MGFFRDLVRSLGPAWLVKDRMPDGEEVDSRALWAISLVLDAQLARLRDGILARYPGPAGAASSSTPGAPEDALSLLGRDRLIIRGPAEPVPSYEARLVRSIDDHRVWGVAWELLEQIRGYCTPYAVAVRTVDQHGNWKAISSTGIRSEVRGSPWDWDGTALAAARSRFWVIIQPEGGTLPWAPEGTWGSGGTWGDGGTWGTTASPEDVQAIRRIVDARKPAGTFCAGITIDFGGTAFDPSQTAPPMPDGTWRWFGDTSSPKQKARDEAGRYWKGTT